MDFSEIMGLREYEINEESTVQDLEAIIQNYNHEKVNLKKNELKRMSREKLNGFL